MMQTYFTRAYFTYLLFSLIIVLMLFSNAKAQKAVALKYLPELSLNKKIANRWSLNLKSAMLNHVYTLEENDLMHVKQTEYLENTILAGYKISSNTNIAIAYMLKVSAPFKCYEISEHRLSQQLSMTQKINKYRFAHRISAEQRMKQELIEYRQRYRLSLDFPLSGERLDNKEFYFISKDELLYTIAKSKVPNYENRFIMGLGYQISEALKFESGLEHRCEYWFSYNNHELLFMNSFYLKL